MHKKIYITEPNDINAIAFELLSKENYELIKGDINLHTNFEDNYEIILIRSLTKVDSNFLNKLPYLKNIIRVGVGLDNIDVKECKERNIEIYNSPGANANAVSELVIMLILIGLRNYHLLQKQDILTWNRRKFLGRELTSQTIGIIGFGMIGKCLGRKLQSMGVDQLIVYDPYLTENSIKGWKVKLVSNIDDLIANSTVISLHVPLAERTKHVVDKSFIDNMNPETILINTSRGEIVDEKELLQRLDEKKLLYIADVFAKEPKVDEDLVHHPRVIATPHIGAMTSEADRDMAEVAVRNFLS